MINTGAYSFEVLPFGRHGDGVGSMEGELVDVVSTRPAVINMLEERIAALKMTNIELRRELGEPEPMGANQGGRGRKCCVESMIQTENAAATAGRSEYMRGILSLRKRDLIFT
jgi:hypothetical protein